MESFFGILKSEMFYGYEKSFQSLKQLEQAILDYIDYYNNKRIKVKLKGLSPVQYRLGSVQSDAMRFSQFKIFTSVSFSI